MAIIHTDRVLHPERKSILRIVIRGWQRRGFCCTLHISVIYIFNILLLKIVRSTDTEGRQSNKESVIWRGGNEKGSHFVICKSLFFFSHYWCRSQRLVNPCSGCFISVYLPAGTKREFLLSLPSLTGPLLGETGETTTGFNPQSNCVLTADPKGVMTSTKGGAGQTLGDSCDAVFAVVGQFMRNWGWTIAVLKFSGLSGLPAKDWWEKTHQSEGANTPHTDHEITCGWLLAWFLPARKNDWKFFVLGWARKALGGLYPELVCQGL